MDTTTMFVLQAVLIPAFLAIFNKLLDFKMEKIKTAQAELLKKQQKEQQAIIDAQIQDMARKQQREAERDDRIELLYDGLTAILRDRILQSSNHFIAKGHITALALENITKMHDVYKAMGGNGLCDKSYAEVHDLPLDKFNQD